MNTITHSRQERELREQVISNCWEYLRDNFHKFSDTNKIKIGLALCTKDMPSKLEGDVGGGTKVILVREKNAAVSRDPSVSTEISGK